MTKIFNIKTALKCGWMILYLIVQLYDKNYSIS
jgi:hypothetical protein